MAHPLALAAVTAVLRSRLRRAVGGEWTPELPRTRVITLPPHSVTVTDETGPIVNVFLWDSRITSELRAGLPATRTSPVGAPRPVVLTYLVSAYGVLPLDADILLGQAMSAMLDEPVITAATIRAALDPDAEGDSEVMSKVFRREAVLIADAVTHLTVACKPMTTTDWAAVWQSVAAPFRPSLMVEVGGVTL